tara:strand:- start:399732 stop:400241 length:510 start_codon:yes stop_codon:yes gene_type:complete
MITVDYVQLMARYNRWMNDKIYAAGAQCSDVQRKVDRGAFFKSIHATLNHLVWADTMWLGRFTKDTPLEIATPTTPIGVDLHADWDALKAARSELDTLMVVWGAKLEQAWLENDFSWYSGLTKSTRTAPAWLLVAHMFNHQTHHRGQVTTLLSQQGMDVGVTDLMMLPR